MPDLTYAEMSNEQRRQFIDVQQTFDAWRKNDAALQSKGSLYWHASKGRSYLYEKHGSIRKSHGPKSPALIKLKSAHDAERKRLSSATKTMRNRLEAMAPVNRALRIGRVPTVAAKIIREINAEGLLGSHIVVAGTNALYAYEAASGVILSSEYVATTDADLLWDTRQSLLLAATNIKPEGIMGILQRVDKSFSADYGMNATNRDGYVVDLLCPEPADQLTMNAGPDLEAIEMPGANWLLDAPRFEHMAVGEDGLPVRMVVPDPRTYALHKAMHAW